MPRYYNENVFRERRTDPLIMENMFNIKLYMQYIGDLD